MSATVYESRSIKKAPRLRRTNAQIAELQAHLLAIVTRDQPMTNRHAFYCMVSDGMLAKTENEYRFCNRQLLTLRRTGRMPYGWLTDMTRWIRRPRTYGSLSAMLANTAQTYRRALWDHSTDAVEIWCESDSIAGVLSEETYLWDVPLMVFKGYSSEGYLYTVGEEIKVHQRATYIYYFGDHDPSGIDIARAALERLRSFAPTARLTFTRVAVTPAQMRDLGLLTKPAKASDSRHDGFLKAFGPATVEIEALPAPLLRTLVRTCIEQHMDAHTLDVVFEIEEQERGILALLADHYRDATGEGHP